ncbi:MAG: hypothetical protein NW224_20065 [Leptolyngbyaceae cyanobacterium bins.302]|nr:hypothetical protein [Leptolyngbyaceae cyanobacterium bins.302]
MRGSLVTYWIKLIYDRNTYIIDLDRVSAFCHAPNGRISFSIMDGNITIVINQQSDPVIYQTILDYIEKKTGMTLL